MAPVFSASQTAHKRSEYVHLMIVNQPELSIAKFIKKLSLRCKDRKVWTLGIILTIQKNSLIGLTPILDKYDGYGTIEGIHFGKYPGYPGGTLVGVINMGTQARCHQTGRSGACVAHLCG